MNWVDMDNLQGGVKQSSIYLNAAIEKLLMWQMIWKPCLPNEGSRVMRKLWREKIPVLFFKEKNEERIGKKNYRVNRT